MSAISTKIAHEKWVRRIEENKVRNVVLNAKNILEKSIRDIYVGDIISQGVNSGVILERICIGDNNYRLITTIL